MRKIIVAFIAGALLSSAVPAYGAISSLVGKRVGSELTVNLDGKNIGSAIVVDGRSYLPVRDTANALKLGLELKKGEVNLTSDAAVKSEIEIESVESLVRKKADLERNITATSDSIKDAEETSIPFLRDLIELQKDNPNDKFKDQRKADLEKLERTLANNKILLEEFTSALEGIDAQIKAQQ